MARGPRCFKWRILISSGPVELLFLDFLMALMVCCSVMTISSDGSFRVLRSMILLLGCVLCLMVLANCLLNRVAFCLLLMAILLLNSMEILGVSLGFLLLRALIVFQSLWVLCLWSQSSSRCSLQS